MQEDNKKVERSTSTRKNIRWNNELLKEIEQARGDQPFSVWVVDACKSKLKKPK